VTKPRAASGQAKACRAKGSQRAPAHVTDPALPFSFAEISQGG
jgi:hypothetical protein